MIYKNVSLNKFSPRLMLLGMLAASLVGMAPTTQASAAGLAPPPHLIAPPNNSAHSGSVGPTFQWAFSRSLAKNEYFMFSIQHKSGADVQCLKATQALARDYMPILALPNNQPFTWLVKVVRVKVPLKKEGEACAGVDVSKASASQNFYWPSQSQAAPKPSQNAAQPPPPPCVPTGKDTCP